MTDDLQRLDPREGIDLYLGDREPELREATLESHEYRLTPFASWMGEQGDLDSLADVRGRHLATFKRERQPEVAPNTLQSQMSTLRQFVRFLESIDAVRPGLSEQVRVPSVEQEARTSRVDRDRARRILDHLSKYRFASREHAIFALVWHTGLRIGGVRALDLDHLALDDDRQPHIEVRHTANETPLKNGLDGERDVGLKPWCVEVIREYVDERREPCPSDRHGRTPLFTTTEGRISEGWIRRTFYQVTQPCMVGECPHEGKEPDTCDWTDRRPSKCPSVEPPHNVRRGAISDHLARGWPIDDLAERVNATPRVIRKHYDVRSTREAMLSRADLLSEEETA
jgi:site-specific recombinase XerC